MTVLLINDRNNEDVEDVIEWDTDVPELFSANGAAPITSKQEEAVVRENTQISCRNGLVTGEWLRRENDHSKYGYQT